MSDETMTVDAALAYIAKHANDRPAFSKDWGALRMLAAEVRRLREENATWKRNALDQMLSKREAENLLVYARAELSRERSEHDSFAEAGRAAELQVVELRAELSRFWLDLKGVQAQLAAEAKEQPLHATGLRYAAQRLDEFIASLPAELSQREAALSDEDGGK